MYPEQQKIYWYSGLYLQPQHFQSIDLHQEWLFAQQRRLSHPHYFGIIEFSIHQSALRDHIFDIESLSLVLPHGEYLTFPGNCRIEKRNFRDAWRQKEQSFTIWLSLSHFNPQSCNVGILKDGQERINSRWINSGDERVMKDIYDRGPETTISRIYYNARVIWDNERENLVDEQCIPLLRLCYDHDGVSIDTTFSPPSLTLYSTPMLGNIIDDIYYELSHRAKKLEEYKRPEILAKISFSEDQIMQMLVMRSLNRILPMLKHYRDARHIHPWDVYGLLCQLVGELSSFNDKCSFLGEWSEGNDLPLNYDHNNLNGCFYSLKKTITGLLNGLILEENTYITLIQNECGIYSCNFKEAHQTHEADSILLLLRSDTFSSEHQFNEVTRNLKIASLESLEALLQHSLPGIPLKLCQTPPHGVPMRNDSCYWELSRNSELWQISLHQKNIAFYWPEAPADLQVQIVFMVS